MLNPTRGPERLIRFGQWLIALLFAYFLIQVGASLIADLPLLAPAPPLERYLDQPRLERLQEQLIPLKSERDRLQQQLSDRQRQEREAQERYSTARASFDNWRSARSATEQEAQNPEVIQRVRQLDGQLAQQQRLGEERRAIVARLREAEQRIAVPQGQLELLRGDANARWEKARQAAQLRAFAIRLLFVGPLLTLALWQFRRFRGCEQWPFVWGFLLFGLFAFFVELVPYLPSFGAYLRYGVGALLTFLGGRALIRWLNAYLLRKQQEQLAPQQERQQRIRYEQALQSLGRGQCPSCERSLSRADGRLSDYCMHCGLQLQHDCSRCGHHQIAFFPFCASCGAPGNQPLTLPTAPAPPLP